MTLIHVSDVNTGDIIEVDTLNPTGTLYVLDYNTGDPVQIDLSNTSGNLYVRDEDTGDLVLLDLSSLSGIIHIIDSDTGNIIEVDLSNPAGLFYTKDDDTGDNIQLDISTDEVIKSVNIFLARNVESDPIGDALRADCVAYWKMDEASGTRADATGRGNDFSSGGNPIGVAGKVNSAVDFDGVTQYLSQTSNPDLMFDGTFSIVTWIKLNSFGDGLGEKEIFSKLDDTSDELYFILFAAAQQIAIEIPDGDYSYPILTHSTLVVADTWYFVCVWVNNDSKTMHISINNANEQQMSIFGDNPSTSATVMIGNYAPNPSILSGIDGIIDEVGFWKRILTADERAYLYNSGNGRSLYS